MQRVWNIPDLPVYSLATYTKDSLNMNICTYVSAVSIQPKRYMVAVYHHTQSLHNVMRSKYFVLQLLGEQNITLVNTLGRKSGHYYNKEHYLRSRHWLTTWHNYTILAHIAGAVELKKLWYKNAGDHMMVLCDVVRAQSFHADVLTLAALRTSKIIRA